MACKECKKTLLKQKLGRCKSCMWQLLILSTAGWLLWLYFYLEQPFRVESIALLFFSGATTCLLITHLVVLLFNLSNDKKPTNR